MKWVGRLFGGELAVDNDMSPQRHAAGDHGESHEEVAGSLTLPGAVSLGTGVMIGAGIFALTGQAAGLAGDLFPVAFPGCGDCGRVQLLLLREALQRLPLLRRGGHVP